MTPNPNVAAAAQRYGFSDNAGQVLFDALLSGGGRQAQFSHPELGGMGQWSGGMTQLGDMFNTALKARVNSFCQELSSLAADVRRAEQEPSRTEATEVSRGPSTEPRSGSWWPEHLGAPSAAGSQNGMSYACFPAWHRLAIARDGHVVLYDTGDHRLGGFSQQQSVGSDLSFSGQHGLVSLSSLPVVSR